MLTLSRGRYNSIEIYRKQKQEYTVSKIERPSFELLFQVQVVCQLNLFLSGKVTIPAAYHITR